MNHRAEYDTLLFSLLEYKGRSMPKTAARRKKGFGDEVPDQLPLPFGEGQFHKAMSLLISPNRKRFNMCIVHKSQKHCKNF